MNGKIVVWYTTVDKSDLKMIEHNVEAEPNQEDETALKIWRDSRAQRRPIQAWMTENHMVF